MKINIKKLNNKAKVPVIGSEQAAGADLYAITNDEYTIIEPHKTLKVKTGLAMEIPKGYFGAIFARSGLATKNGLRPANCVGVVDSDYRGEIIVALHNDSDDIQVVSTGDRVAQIVILPYLSIDFNEVDELTYTNRGEKGFGSTGMN